MTPPRCAFAAAALAIIGLSTASTAAHADAPLFEFTGESSCVVDFSLGAVIFQQHGEQPMSPASVMKLVTAETVLSQLGATQRFVTEVYADGASWRTLADGSSLLVARNLYLKGYGDPILVSEEWTRLVAALPPLELSGAIVADDSYFAEELGIIQEPDVLDPYNALNGAFASNFNTFAFTLDRGRIVPEAQTPLTSYTRVALHNRPRQRWFGLELDERRDHLGITVSGKVKRRRRHFRVHLGFRRENGARYAGHLFQAIWNRDRPAPLRARVTVGVVPAGATLIHRHHSSHTARQAVASLMEYSNNFLANQLLLVTGAARFGPPATLDKGLRALRDTLAERDAGPVVVKEGSGLDPDNRISACTLARFLWRSQERGSALPELLQRYGQAAAKTGTFDANGVRTLAGYLLAPDGKPGAAFAFMCNGPCSRATHDRYKLEADEWAQFLFRQYDISWALPLAP